MLSSLLLLLAPAPVKLTLDFKQPAVEVSPNLYGLMTEEINFSYDGGLYGELVRNRAFKDDPATPVHWSAVGDGSSAVLDSASLRVKGAVANEGYWGIPVKPATSYRLSVWAKADGPGPLVASIESPDGAIVYGKTEIKGVGGEWGKYVATLKTIPNAMGNTEARLVLRMGDGRSVWLRMVSLFPPTFHGRPNGNRVDLMEKLIDMKPKFLRFPGGNYLEGNRISERFPWKETLGPIEDRPGHRSPWGYRSTDGMGLLEFLEWCEDMKAKPLLAVFAGYALNREVVKAGPDLKPYVDDALDEIEYVTGGPETKWGARRVKDGHPKPFPLEWVEVGNEDGFDRSGSYPGRFAQFYDAIKAKYPNLQVISTTGGKDPLGARSPITDRKPDLIDEHYYAPAWDMMAMATKYDDYDRKGPKIFVGEWASHDGPQPWVNAGRNGPTPDLRCALADAAFMTGLERNSDIVKMACYAPLLVNVNPGGRQWAVNLIGYDALSSYGSPSYYAQTMFGGYVGDRTVPVSLSGGPTQSQGEKTLPGLFVSATRDSRGDALYLKVVNATSDPVDVAIDLVGRRVATDGTMVVLSGDPAGVNGVGEPTKIAPVASAVTGLGKSFPETFAPYSITVLRMSLR